MNLQSITPCTGWVYRLRTEEPAGAVFPVAAWGVTEAGEVVGLIGGTQAVTPGGTPCLTTPPKGKGEYLPESAIAPAV